MKLDEILELVHILRLRTSMKTTQHKCRCGRTAKYSYPIHGDKGTVYACGYHTWWHGTRVSGDFLERLQQSHRLEGE